MTWGPPRLVPAIPAPGFVRVESDDGRVIFTCPSCFRVFRMWPVRVGLRRFVCPPHEVSGGFGQCVAFGEPLKFEEGS